MWSSNIQSLLGMALWLQKAGFQVAAFIGFKDFQDPSVICFNKSKGKSRSIKVDLKKIFAMGFLFQKLFTVLCAKDFENTSILETVATVQNGFLIYKYHQGTKSVMTLGFAKPVEISTWD